MGSGEGPKRSDPGAERDDLTELEEVIYEAIVNREVVDDVSLNRIIELTIASINREQPLFPDIMSEPTLYRRYIYPWIKSALHDRSLTDGFSGSAVDSISNLQMRLRAR